MIRNVSWLLIIIVFLCGVGVDSSSSSCPNGKCFPKGVAKDDYIFTQDWFSVNVKTWMEILVPLYEGKMLDILEIGPFEGRSTSWLLKNIATHPKSTITCIDTWEGSMEHKLLLKLDYSKTLDTFLHNMAATGHSDKVRWAKARSSDWLIANPKEKFDLVYIDGSHEAIHVLEDAVLSFRTLKVGGILIFDDLGWNNFEEEVFMPRLAISAFFQVYQNELELVASGWQLILRKISPRVTVAHERVEELKLTRSYPESKSDFANIRQLLEEENIELDVPQPSANIPNKPPKTQRKSSLDALKKLKLDL